MRVKDYGIEASKMRLFLTREFNAFNTFVPSTHMIDQMHSVGVWCKILECKRNEAMSQV